MATKPLPERSIQELLAMATEFDAMAATAATQDVKQGLENVAARFRTLAAARANGHTKSMKPGEPAPVAGRYELHNALGLSTGEVVHIQQGQPLPRAPRAFMWHLSQQP